MSMRQKNVSESRTSASDAARALHLAIDRVDSGYENEHPPFEKACCVAKVTKDWNALVALNLFNDG